MAVKADDPINEGKRDKINIKSEELHSGRLHELTLQGHPKQ